MRKPSSRTITDLQVCEAYRRYNEQVDSTPFGEADQWPAEILSEITGAPEDSCIRAIERAGRRGFIHSTIRLKVATLTPRGKEYLRLGILGIDPP